MIYSLIELEKENISILQETENFSIKNRPDFKVNSCISDIEKERIKSYLFLEDGEIFGAVFASLSLKDRRCEVNFILKDPALNDQLLRLITEELPLSLSLSKIEVYAISSDEVLNTALKNYFILDAELREAVFNEGEFEDLNYYSYIVE